jgi:hypothetical protein
MKLANNIFINNSKILLPFKENNKIIGKLLFIFGNNYDDEMIINKMMNNKIIKNVLHL